jgi:DNA polymerase III subunit beta
MMQTVETEGILSINSKKFFEIIREYPDNEIPVNEVENRWVEIGNRGQSFSHIVSSDYENFPETPVIENVEFIEINAR